MLDSNSAVIVTPARGKKTAGRSLAYSALAAVCVLWGTTYLGIRISLQSLPPLYLIAIRYTISGALLLLGLRMSGARMPGRRDLVLTAICGVVCIGVGNGLLAIAEVWIPSGLAALFYTTCPFWMVGIDALLPQGKKPLAITMLGLTVGMLGVVYLILPDALREGVRGPTVSGFLLLQLSAAGWVAGALLQKRVRSAAAPITIGAVQQLAAGLATFFPAVLFEPAPHSVSRASASAVAYLVVFGSLIGFTSFVYSMAKLPTALVSIYTFVNPVVAVFLGFLFFREPFGWRELAAMVIIFVGVAVVKWSEVRDGRKAVQAAVRI